MKPLLHLRNRRPSVLSSIKIVKFPFDFAACSMLTSRTTTPTASRRCARARTECACRLRHWAPSAHRNSGVDGPSSRTIACAHQRAASTPGAASTRGGATHTGCPEGVAIGFLLQTSRGNKSRRHCLRPSDRSLHVLEISAMAAEEAVRRSVESSCPRRAFQSISIPACFQRITDAGRPRRIGEFCASFIITERRRGRR